MSVVVAEPAVDRPLAVFDLDGTLLTRDSFLPFLLGYGLRRRRLRALAVTPFYLALYASRLMSDRSAKQGLLVAYFRGESADAIADHADRFCETWVAKRLRAEVIERLRYHQSAGHRVVLLSASPDIYVSAIGKALGIGEVIATRVTFDGDTCVGRIDGANCKGAAKIAAVQELLKAERPPGGSSAYGDSRHDVPLLKWVQHGFLVSRRGLAEIRSQESGVRSQHP
ncbi:MAG: HAD-IB family hydrolase [Gemmataceae bacterium]